MKLFVTITRRPKYVKEKCQIVFEGRIDDIMEGDQTLKGKRRQFRGISQKLATGDKVYIETENCDAAEVVCSRVKWCIPDSQDGVRQFLNRWIGSTKLVHKIVKVCGDDALSKILKDADAYDSCAVDKDDVQKIRDDLRKRLFIEETMDLLHSSKMDVSQVVRMFAEYDMNDAFRTIATAPFQAYEDGILDFRAAELLFLANGNSEHHPRRLYYGVLETLRRSANDKGHAYLQMETLLDETYSLLDYVPIYSIPRNEIEAEVRRMIADGAIISEKSWGGNDIYLPHVHRQEEKCAERLGTLLTGKKRGVYEPMFVMPFLKKLMLPTGRKLSDEQIAAIANSINAPVSIITGGPGTGKTSVLMGLTKAIREFAPYHCIRACAFTGKAAAGLTAAMQGDVQADTIHRLLRMYSGKGQTLWADYLYVDEASMIDTELLGRLLDIVPENCRVIFVGDSHQLPPIAYGQTFRDLVDSDLVSISCLTQVFRQAQNSQITQFAQDMLQSNLNAKTGLEHYKKEDFDFYEVGTEEGVVQEIERILCGLRDPEQCLILSPFRAGALGSAMLNQKLRHIFNKMPPTKCGYAVGDRVMQCVNRYQEGKNVRNGQIGKVVKIETKPHFRLTVDFEGVQVVYQKNELEDLTLAYATTIHRSQGSEWPVVIMPLLDARSHFLHRPLMYTAVTRAKEHFYGVGSEQAFCRAAMRKETQRNSHLIDRLKRQLTTGRAA